MNISLFEEIKDVNLIGEILRNMSFESYPEKIACYDHFEVKKSLSKMENGQLDLEVQEIISDIIGIGVEELKSFTVYRFPENGTIMAYFYDASGTLMFITPHNKVFVNDDCKKSYGWKTYEI